MHSAERSPDVFRCSPMPTEEIDVKKFRSNLELY
jgi:hypothetical protein